MRRFFLPVILLVAFTALQPVPVPQTFGSRGPRIKAVINLRAQNAVVDYSYMTSGNVAEMRDSHGYSTVFTYTDTLATRQLSNQTGVDTFILNKSGLAKESIGYSGVRYRFTYNADGFLVKTESYLKGYRVGGDQYTITGGNIQCMMKLGVNDRAKSSTCYSYIPNTINTIGNGNLGLSFLGRSSKNLVKESVSLGPTGDTIMHLYYHYHFDNQNRVKEKLSYRANGQPEDSVRYVYMGE